jgi:DNA-binding MarR family transcriptional regulator
MSLQQEIQQAHFRNEYQKAHINLLFTASWLNLQATKSLKPFNISPQQFNILRILRGFYPEPATVKVLTERMVDKMSNASRLVEKLKQKGLVEREASDEDRRRVNVHITPAGLQLIEQATLAMENNVEKLLNRVEAKDVAWLNQLLDQLRG